MLGVFTLDMVQATGNGTVPTNIFKNSGAAAVGSPTDDHDWAAIIHAVLTCLAFLFLMPLGAIYLRVLGSFRWHWINQLFACLIAFIGVGLGFYLSTIYNHTKSFNSAHQIIGILLAIALAIQLSLGYFHHRIFKRTQGSTLYALIHRYFGQLTIVVAVVNGGLGLPLASNTRGLAVYITLVIIAMAVYFGVLAFNRFRSVHKVKQYQHPGATRPDSVEINLNGMGKQAGNNQI